MIRITDKKESDGYNNDGTLMVLSGEKAYSKIVNPATGAVVGRVPDLGAREAKAAIDAANSVFPEWSGLLAVDRAKILRRRHLQ